MATADEKAEGYRRDACSTRRGNNTGETPAPLLRGSDFAGRRALPKEVGKSCGASNMPFCETNPFHFRVVFDVSIVNTETYAVCRGVCKWVRSGKTNPFLGGSSDGTSHPRSSGTDPTSINSARIRAGGGGG